MLKKIWFGLSVGLAAALAAWLAWLAGALTDFEAQTWDWREQWLARKGPATDHIRLILLDQNSLDWGVQENGLSWPWPREVYKPILDFCRRQGARAVAFDVLFTEPSKYEVQDDATLGAAIAATRGFVGAVFLGTNSGSCRIWPPNLPPPRINAYTPEGTAAVPWLASVRMPRATFPVPEIATNTTLLAAVNATPDSDGIYRRVRLFHLFDDKIIPALGLGLLLAAEPGTQIEITPRTMRIGGRLIPLDHKGRAILRFRGPSQTHKTFSAAAVIQSELRLQAGEQPPITDSQALKDCYVFFGFSAPGLYDLRPSPVDGVYPGVEIYATLLDNLLSRDVMQETPDWLTPLLSLALGCFWGLLMIFGRNARDNLIAIGLALPAPAILAGAAYLKGYWLPFMPLETATALALAGAVLVNYATEGKQKRFIRGAFKQYLSAAVIDELVRHPERLSLGGEQRTLSIFFSDLQGFTGISEGLTPQALTALLNDYLTAMTDIIQDEGGTVDKYEGDAIIAFWNAPLAQEDHATRAVRAALRAQTKLAALRPELKNRIGKDMFMRIGLNTGPVVVGNMGSHNRFNYTILGDAANLASRLEGINKQFGTFTLISETTHAAMEDAFAAREISRVAVVGRKAPVRVFEPMFPESWEARQPDLERFARGLIAFYEGRFAEASTWFDPLQAIDPPAAAYVRKCRALLAAPPARWDGVWVMTEK